MTLAVINDWEHHFHSLRLIFLSVGKTPLGGGKYVYATLLIWGYGFQLRSS